MEKQNLFSRAQNIIPGGVNSPVRAFRSVGGQPLFIKRAKRPGDLWSGHMAFPGGHWESSDADLAATAVRETREDDNRTGLALRVEPVTPPPM